MMREQWTVAQRAAEEVVRKYRTFDPQNVARNIDFGGGDSNTSQTTQFARSGTSALQKEFDLPGFLSALIKSSAEYNPLSASTASSEGNALLSLLSQSAASVPGLSVLQAIQQIDPTSFNGLNALTTIAQRNPYSTDWENSTSDLYNRSFTKARAEAQSGPTNVRGGTARSGFELADVDSQQSLGRFREVRDQQNREAGIVQNAVQLANAIEAMRRGSQLQSQQQQQTGETQRSGQTLEASAATQRARANNAANLQMAGDLLGKGKQTQTDNLKGLGTQVQDSSFSNWNAGLSCCFIFLEHFNGQLPNIVRMGRDEFATGRRIDGYRWMARWLVPWMRRRRWVAQVVNWLMVKPFIAHGTWHYHRLGGWRAAVLMPVCYGWFAIWSLCSCGKDLWRLKTL